MEGSMENISEKKKNTLQDVPIGLYLILGGLLSFLVSLMAAFYSTSPSSVVLSIGAYVSVMTFASGIALFYLKDNFWSQLCIAVFLFVISIGAAFINVVVAIISGLCGLGVLVSCNTKQEKV